jgi:hypothetical protein
MSLCKYCGSDTADDRKICLHCKRLIEALKKDMPPIKINGFDINDVKKNKSIACLSYLPFLFLLPLLICPKSKYAIYHAGYGFRLTLSGIVLTTVDIIIRFIFNTFFPLIYNKGTSFEYISFNATGNIISLVFGISAMSVYLILLITGVYCAYKCKIINLLFIKNKKK